MSSDNGHDTSMQAALALVEAAVARVSLAKISELSVVDGGDGASFTGAVASFPAAVREVLEQTGRAFGLDLRALLGEESPSEGGR